MNVRQAAALASPVNMASGDLTRYRSIHQSGDLGIVVILAVDR